VYELLLFNIYRLERAVFGDPSDIINNLSDNESDTHVKVENKSANEEAIHEDKDEIKIEEDHLSNIIDRTDEKKAAWIDEDDVTYRFIYNYLLIYIYILLFYIIKALVHFVI
jgi:hypothetical protein